MVVCARSAQATLAYVMRDELAAQISRASRCAAALIHGYRCEPHSSGLGLVNPTETIYSSIPSASGRLVVGYLPKQLVTEMADKLPLPRTIYLGFSINNVIAGQDENLDSVVGRRKVVDDVNILFDSILLERRGFLPEARTLFCQRL